MEPSEDQNHRNEEEAPSDPPQQIPEIMFPLGGNCFVPASRVADPGTGARYRAARLLEGLSHQEVADRGNESPVVVNSQMHGPRPLHLTAEHVLTLEENPGGTAIWIFDAVAHGIGRHPTEIMEMVMTTISPDDAAEDEER